MSGLEAFWRWRKAAPAPKPVDPEALSDDAYARLIGRKPQLPPPPELTEEQVAELDRARRQFAGYR